MVCATVSGAVRYYVTLGPEPDERPTIVDIVELPNGMLRVDIDERPVDVDVVIADAQLNVRVGGQVVDFAMQGRPPDIEVCTTGFRSRVRVESERMRSVDRRGSPKSESGDRIIKSPMPGRVVRVLVSKGDAVRAGQGLVVLEAMKMENEVRARASGTIAQVHVDPGTTVDRNAVLVTLR
jgi:glutaconyl-CoA/methylmalonyl-CoA decarboxylase subunit gamma